MDHTGQKGAIISVLDLPQLYTRPSATDLISTLDHLKVKHIAWDDDSEVTNDAIDEEGVPKYLTSIVASSLAWVEEDSIKEQIWEAASARLCERSGRSAIPSVSRTFIIPATEWTDSISINLYEPSLTADNLGHKTWLASFLLAKRLPSLISYLPPLNHKERSGQHLSTSNISNSNTQVIELGAGTGLVGLAVAAFFDAYVHLTDLPAIVPNLRANVANNARGNTSVGELDWSNLPCPQDVQRQEYDLVIAADPIYSPQHPAWLVAAIECVLRHDRRARVVIELPLREAYAPEVEELKNRMELLGLSIEAEGQESGFEDWQSPHDKNTRTEVKCWWAVWRWTSID